MTDRASSREVWRETRPLTRPVQRLYLVAAAAVIVSTLITLAGPALVRYAVDNGIVKKEQHPVDVAALAILALALVKPFVVRVQTLAAAKANVDLVALGIAVFVEIWRALFAVSAVIFEHRGVPSMCSRRPPTSSIVKGTSG